MRFNTLDQGPGFSTGGFLEIWILDAANTNRYDMVSLYSGINGNSSALLAGSSIDNAYNTLPFNFQTNTWYRLVLTAPLDQGVRAAVLSDDWDGADWGFLRPRGLGLQFGLQDRVSPNSWVRLPWQPRWMWRWTMLRLTSGQSGEVNQAFFGDGLATRMIVPRCPELDLGRGRGFSIEGWINPANVANTAPLVEWYDSAAPANESRRGVQFWLGLTNSPGSLTAILWDTNSQPHPIATPPLALTNAGWQHVALTYDTNSGSAVLYTNGQNAATVQFLTNFVPRTSGDLYLGYDPAVVPTPISYTNFSSTAGLNLVGSAAQIGTVLAADTGCRETRWGTRGRRPNNRAPPALTRASSSRCSNPGGPAEGMESRSPCRMLGPTSATGYAHSSAARWVNFVSVFFNTASELAGLHCHCDVSGNSVGIVTNGALCWHRWT